MANRQYAADIIGPPFRLSSASPLSLIVDPNSFNFLLSGQLWYSVVLVFLR